MCEAMIAGWIVVEAKVPCFKGTFFTYEEYRKCHFEKSMQANNDGSAMVIASNL